MKTTLAFILAMAVALSSYGSGTAIEVTPAFRPDEEIAFDGTDFPYLRAPVEASCADEFAQHIRTARNTPNAFDQDRSLQGGGGPTSGSFYGQAVSVDGPLTINGDLILIARGPLHINPNIIRQPSTLSASTNIYLISLTSDVVIDSEVGFGSNGNDPKATAGQSSTERHTTQNGLPYSVSPSPKPGVNGSGVFILGINVQINNLVFGETGGKGGKGELSGRGIPSPRYADRWSAMQVFGGMGGGGGDVLICAETDINVRQAIRRFDRAAAKFENDLAEWCRHIEARYVRYDGIPLLALERMRNELNMPSVDVGAKPSHVVCDDPACPTCQPANGG